MLINTTVLVFCVGSFWFCRGSPKESCYQPIFYSSQALKKDTLKQPESPGQVGRLSSPLPRQKPSQTKPGIVHSAHYLFPGLNFAIVPPDPGSQSVRGTLRNASLAPPLTGIWVWELLPGTGCPQNHWPILLVPKPVAVFSVCVCVGRWVLLCSFLGVSSFTRIQNQAGKANMDYLFPKGSGLFRRTAFSCSTVLQNLPLQRQQGALEYL